MAQEEFVFSAEQRRQNAAHKEKARCLYFRLEHKDAKAQSLATAAQLVEMKLREANHLVKTTREQVVELAGDDQELENILEQAVPDHQLQRAQMVAARTANDARQTRQKLVEALALIDTIQDQGAFF